MTTLLGFVGKIFGLGSGGTLMNNIGGAVTHVAALPAIYYLLDHANETIQMNVSLGFLGVVVAFGYLLLELARRSASGAA